MMKHSAEISLNLVSFFLLLGFSLHALLHSQYVHASMLLFGGLYLGLCAAERHHRSWASSSAETLRLRLSYRVTFAVALILFLWIWIGGMIPQRQ